MPVGQWRVNFLEPRFREPQINEGIYPRKSIDRHKVENFTVAAVAGGAADGAVQFSSEGTIGSSMMSVLGRESAAAATYLFVEAPMQNLARRLTGKKPRTIPGVSEVIAHTP